MRVLLLGTYRDVEARMDAATGELSGARGARGRRRCRSRGWIARRRRDLRPGRVGPVGADVEARIFERTQGNPLFLVEMLRLLDEQGADAIAAGVVPAACAT